MPLLLKLMERSDGCLSLRTTAMTALTMLLQATPEEMSNGDEDCYHRVVSYLQWTLPPAIGTVPTLRALCVDVVARTRTNMANEGKPTIPEMNCPVELEEIVAKRVALMKLDPASRRALQLYAAVGLTRLVLKKIGVPVGQEYEHHYWADDNREELLKAEEVKRRNKIQVAMASEDLAPWLPQAESVLIDFFSNPSQFATHRRDTSGESDSEDEEEEEEEEEEEGAEDRSMSDYAEDFLFAVYLAHRFLKHSGLFNEDSLAEVLLNRFRVTTTIGKKPKPALHKFHYLFFDLNSERCPFHGNCPP